MKKVIIFLSVSFLLVANNVWAAHTITQLWKTEGLPVPESVLYVAGKSPYLLVSLIDGESAVADHKGGIAKLSLTGEVLDLAWVQGLNAPKGMATDGKNLYVADITELVIIDINDQTITQRIPVPNSVFLNDVAISSKGVVYVSDTRTGKVFQYQKGELVEYLDGVKDANGLHVLGKNLVVGSGTELVIYNAQKQRLVIAKNFAKNLDGIVLVGRGEFIVSSWFGLIYYVGMDGSSQLLLDSQAEGINTADLGYDPFNKQVFVPNFLKNSVTAYQLD